MREALICEDLSPKAYVKDVPLIELILAEWIRVSRNI